MPKKPGPPVLSSDPNMLSNEEAGHHVRDIAYFRSANTLCLDVLCGGGGITILERVVTLRTYRLRILDFLPEAYKAKESCRAFNCANFCCFLYFSLNKCLNCLKDPKMNSLVLPFIIG